MIRNGDQYKDAMAGAIGAAKTQAATETVSKLFGGILGFAFATFAVPFIALYAWDAMTPEDWINWQYLPTVAAMFVFRIIIHWVRTE